MDQIETIMSDPVLIRFLFSSFILTHSTSVESFAVYMINGQDSQNMLFGAQADLSAECFSYSSMQKAPDGSNRRAAPLFGWAGPVIIKRPIGIEPTSSAWKAEVLPLYDRRGF